MQSTVLETKNLDDLLIGSYIDCFISTDLSEAEVMLDHNDMFDIVGMENIASIPDSLVQAYWSMKTPKSAYRTLFGTIIEIVDIPVEEAKKYMLDAGFVAQAKVRIHRRLESDKYIPVFLQRMADHHQNVAILNPSYSKVFRVFSEFYR